jgi:hypothetical protein
MMPCQNADILENKKLDSMKMAGKEKEGHKVICWLWDEPMTGRFGYGMNQ